MKFKKKLVATSLSTILGLSALTLTGCDSREEPNRSYTVSGVGFDNELGNLLYDKMAKTHTVESINYASRPKGYPSSGTLPLPRAEVKEFERELRIKLYFPAGE